MDCFTCSTNCDLIHIYCFILFLFWPLSIGLRLFYRRKWTFIAEKHLCGRVKTRTALRTSWTTTYGPTHHNNFVFLRFRVQQHRVKSCISTKLGQAIGIEYISYNLMRSGSEPFTSKPSPPETFPSESFLRFLVSIGCGVCSVFFFFLGSSTSTLA